MWPQNKLDSDGILGLNKSPIEYFSTLRWIRRFLIQRGIGYKKLNVDQKAFQRLAMNSSPFVFRWLGDSITFEELNECLKQLPDFDTAIRSYETGDKIWPFVINPYTLSMRKGYVIVRNNNPVTTIVITMS